MGGFLTQPNKGNMIVRTFKCHYVCLFLQRISAQKVLEKSFRKRAEHLTVAYLNQLNVSLRCSAC